MTTTPWLLVLAAACGGEIRGDARSGTGGVEQAAAHAAGGSAGKAGAGGTTSTVNALGGSATGTGGVLGRCTAEQRARFLEDLTAALPEDAARCLYAAILIHPVSSTESVTYDMEAVSSSGIYRFTDCSPEQRRPYQSALEQALATVGVPACSSQMEVVRLSGQVGSDQGALVDYFEACEFMGGVRMGVDGVGNVTEVTVFDPVTPNPVPAECITSTLTGLSFPCLSGMQVCVEFTLAD